MSEADHHPAAGERDLASPVAVPRGWRSLGIPLGLIGAGLIVAMGYGTLFALLADVQDRHELPTWNLGVITAAAFITSAVAQLTLPRLVDRGHGRALLTAALAMAGIGTVWFGFGTKLWELTVARGLFGLGGGAFFPAVRGITVRLGDVGLAERLGRLTSLNVLGFLIGPPAATALAGAWGLRAPFLVQGVILLAATPLCRRVQAHVAAPVHSHGRPLGQLLRIPSMRAALVLSAAMFYALGTFDTMWSRFLTDRGAGTALIGWSFTLSAAPLAVLSPLGGRLTDRVGASRAAIVALAGVVAVFIGYATVEVVPVLITLAVVQSVFESVLNPSVAAQVARSSPPHLLALGQGLSLAVASLASAVAATIAALLYDTAGSRAAWFAGALAMVALATVASRLGRRLPGQS